MKYPVSKRAIAMIAALSMPAAAMADRDADRCVEASHVGALAMAMLPGAVSKLSENCASTLPQGAALLVSGAGAAEKYKDAAEAARPEALEAIKTIVGEDMPDGMSTEVIFPFFEMYMFAEIEKGNMAETCPVANNIWAALKDLPFDKWGMTLAAIVSAQNAKKTDEPGAKKRKSKIDLPICSYLAMEA